MSPIQKLISRNSPKNGKFYLIAIDGRGGSGKTTFSDVISEQLKDFILLHGDDYFEPADDGVAWGYFNDNRFINDVIKPLKSSNRFEYRPYDWHANPHISSRKVTVENGLVLERGYSFDFDLDWDLKIWVETPREICFERGVAREDMEVEKSKKAWMVWQKTEDSYISKYKPQKTADLVIDGTLSFSDQLDSLK